MMPTLAKRLGPWVLCRDNGRHRGDDPEMMQVRGPRCGSGPRTQMDLTAAALAWAVGKSGTVTKMPRDRNSDKDRDELGFYWPDGMGGESQKSGQLTGEPVMLCFSTPDLTDGESHLLLIFCGVTSTLSDCSASHLWSVLIGWSLCQSNRKRTRIPSFFAPSAHGK